MRTILLFFTLIALSASQCTTMTSTWVIKDLPVLGNNIQLRFQRRLNSAGVCLHYMRMRSPCTMFEVTYTTSDFLGVIVWYTLDTDPTPPVNYGNCPNLNIANLQANIVWSLYPPKGGWYYLFLPNVVLPGKEKLAWGGYIADWQSGPLQVWWT